jgi:hypothetical protein
MPTGTIERDKEFIKQIEEFKKKLWHMKHRINDSKVAPYTLELFDKIVVLQTALADVRGVLKKKYKYRDSPIKFKRPLIARSTQL